VHALASARRSGLAFAFTAGVAGIVTGAAPAAAQRAEGFASASLAGESIALLPLTLTAADPSLASDSALAPVRGRRGLAWADSTIADAFQSRAPEVTWVTPAQLRRVAHRNPGMVPEPDQMGQAVLRAPKLKRIPDPLRSSLRNLCALTGGRFAMVPASLVWTRDTTGAFRAALALALADTRSGFVAWRTETAGTGHTPAEALAAALALVLPVDPTGQ
jgi:hypothetical protein